MIRIGGYGLLSVAVESLPEDKVSAFYLDAVAFVVAFFGFRFSLFFGLLSPMVASFAFQRVGEHWRVLPVRTPNPLYGSHYMFDGRKASTWKST